MRVSLLRQALFPILLLAAAAGPAVALDALELRLVAGGIERPLGLVHAGDGTDRLFLVQQMGLVWIVRDGELEPKPFLDISDRVSCCGGRGLLGLAFHPDHESNGFLFANYINKSGDSVVARFRVARGNPDRVRLASETEFLRFEQAPSGHKGGDMAFGPDGFLYVASGDGSDGADPQDSAQNLSSLLGKILRLDVDGGPGAVPSSNPFVGDPQARHEIWASGLRNPWRISFDRKTGDLFITDVGEGRREEVNFQSADSEGGENYGWNRLEGSLCFDPPADCDPGAFTAPVLEYGHDLGCSITGGYRYRGKQAATLGGEYLFADYCAGSIWSAKPNRNGLWVSRVLASTGRPIVSFGEDERGELYVVDFTGEVNRLHSREILADGFEGGDLGQWKKKGPVEVVEPGLMGSGFALSVAAEPGRVARIRTRAPSRADHLGVGFRFAGRDLELSGGESDLLTLRDGRGSHGRLALERLSKKRLRAVLWVRERSGSERRVGEIRFNRKKILLLEVEWTSASTPTTDDGVARLIRNGKVVGEARDLGTGSRSVTTLDLGLVGAAGTGSSGRLLLDEISVTR